MNNKIKIVAVRLTEEQYERLLQQTYGGSIPVSSLVRQAITQWLEFQVKLNELRLQELQKKLDYDKAMEGYSKYLNGRRYV